MSCWTVHSPMTTRVVIVGAFAAHACTAWRAVHLLAPRPEIRSAACGQSWLHYGDIFCVVPPAPFHLASAEFCRYFCRC